MDVGKEVLEKVEKTAERGEASVIARLNPRTQVQKGDRIELVVDTTRLHFFDPDDGTVVHDNTDMSSTTHRRPSKEGTTT